MNTGNKVELSVVQDEEKRILELISGAKRVDIVSAWVTPTESFWKLVKRAEREDNFFNLLVGTSSDGTDPQIFTILEKVPGASCKVPSQELIKSGSFHPKLYIFHGVKGQDIVLIGSMNFTNSGLHKNKELLIELRGNISDLEKWFHDIWLDSNPIGPEELEKCRLAWDGRGNSSNDTDKESSNDGNILSQKKKIFSSWRNYKIALEERAQFLTAEMKGQNEQVVLGKNDIWTKLILEAKKVLESKKWSKKSGRVLVGNIYPYKPFGNMRGNRKFCGVMVNSKDPILRDVVRKTLEKFKKLKVSHLTPEKRAKVVCFYLTKLCELDSVGISSATRLLTLTRPDLAFSYNGSSSKNLNFLGGIPTDERTEVNYQKLLEMFYSTKWYQSEEPKYPGPDKLIWKCRLALIDLLVYEHNNGH
ncbi:phospholipase D family protein [uncultured Parasutterella sp.]|uniref:phospholipase D family protein n=3 Tax=uncultured Parasutterella sp. TaxID=1263098 RepID=UPI0025ED1DA1|nr:phospholipase D family protein [uncultured Parasutterella sp.]